MNALWETIQAAVLVRVIGTIRRGHRRLDARDRTKLEGRSLEIESVE